jgi:tetratricopeptide (TPR) repeat protein
MSNASDKEKDSLSLESLAAYLESYSSGADAALAKLRPIPGPASIEHQLKILLRENRTEEALALISNETPDLQWIALGIQTAATQGALEISKKLFDEVDRSADVTLRIRCAIGHAEGSLKAIFAAHGDPPFLIPGDISVQENSALLGAVAHFSPLLSQISARGVVDNELESQGLQLLLTIWLLIGDREKAGDVVAFLFKRTPIPLRAVEAVMQGLLTCDPSLPSKVRTDHPGSFKAGILACLLEGRILNQPKFAFHNAVKLKVLASNEEDKESLAEFLYEMAAKLNDNAFVEFAVQTARELLSEESNVTALIEIDTILRSGDAEAALQRLLAMDDQDNAIWLGLYGSVLLKLGKEEKALEAFLSLSKKSPEPSVFRQISALARKVGDENTRELALLTLLKIDPNDIWTRQELGKIYAESKRYTLAIEQFRWLSWNEPEEVGYSINLAVSLTFSGDLGSAATVLEEAVRRHPTELRVLVLLSEVYLSQGHSQRAFSCLDSFKNSYWESPEFLLPYMNAGYASGHENEASAAFVKLQELNDEGQVGPGLIRAVPLDEVVQLVKHDRQQNTEWLKGEVAGEMPWVLAASLRNEVPYSAWFHKTRPIRFSYEDASTWAAAHTYITNGFRIYEKDAGNLELSAFTAPNSQNEVVVDLSSLIILNELDLLDVVADFFSKLVIPADYISRIAHETKNLFPHQASQQEAAESISRSIERGQIRIVNIEQQAVLPVVDEYNHDALNKSENYSLDEIFEVMHRNGYLSDAMRERAKKLASPQGKQKENLSLFPRQSLVIALSSLRTVVMTGLLEPLIRCFVVCISNEDERDNADRVNFYS